MSGRRKTFKKPEYLSDFPELNKARDETIARLAADKTSPTVDLNETLEIMRKYQQLMKELPRPERTANIGKLGMEDLVKIVADLKQDVKRIDAAQSLKSAEEWIKDNDYDNLLEVVSTDLNKDRIPEIVVQTKADQKPVIVNGYTTAPSLFPYRHLYYKAFPTNKERKQAKKDGIQNYRDLINRNYNPQYDSLGREIKSYNEKYATDLENRIISSGYSKIVKPHNRSTFQIFVTKVVKPIYRSMQYCFHLKSLPFTLMHLAKAIWDNVILIPAMMRTYGPAIEHVSDQEWKTLRSKKFAKKNVDKAVMPYLTNPATIIDKAIPVAVDMLVKIHAPVRLDHIPLFKVAAAAYIHGLDPNNLPNPPKSLVGDDEDTEQIQYILEWGEKVLPSLINEEEQRENEQMRQEIEAQNPGYYDNNEDNDFDQPLD